MLNFASVFMSVFVCLFVCLCVHVYVKIRVLLSRTNELISCLAQRHVEGGGGG